MSPPFSLVAKADEYGIGDTQWPGFPPPRDPVEECVLPRAFAPEFMATLFPHPRPEAIDHVSSLEKGVGNGLPAQFEQVNLNAAGIDVGSAEHWVAVPPDRAPEAVRKFGAFTADLRELAGWLRVCRIETVVMESTGVSWIPLFELLESEGFQVLLVDPRGLKSVPGRKTDASDCQWLQQLCAFGLLSGPSGRPRRCACCGRTCVSGGCWWRVCLVTSSTCRRRCTR